MRKVDKLIQETEENVKQVRDQINQLTANRQQIDQQLQQNIHQHDQFVARGVTLKEIAGMGDTFLAEVPNDGAIEKIEQTASAEAEQQVAQKEPEDPATIVE